MSARGRGRGRGRGGSSAVGGVTTRSSKRTSDASDVAEPQNKVAHHEDPNSDDEDITFHITESALEARISAAINSIVPTIVAQTAEAAIKSMQSKAISTPQPSTSKAPETVTPLQQAVEQQTSVISGNAATADNTTSSEIPLDLHLKPEMLAQIKGYKYVKFGELLIKEQRDNEKMTLHLGDNTSSKQIMVGPYFNQVKIVHINQWIRAFDIFSYVLVRAHPEDATGLIQYGNLIKDMAFRGLNWANYDRQFRRLKERNPSQHPWGCTDLTLFSQNIMVPRWGNMNSHQTPQGQNNQNMPFRAQGWQGNNNHSNRPVKKCFAFNKNFCRFGPRCRYAHICTKCEGMHPASKCRA